MMVHFLANHKTLALSIALIPLLAVVLSILIYFVYPRFTWELVSVSNWGRYSVRTYRQDERELAYCEVLMGHRRLYSLSGTLAFFVETFGADVTGNGIPDLFIRQWYGSAHGDSKYIVLELDGSLVKEVDAIDGLLGAACRDLNDDGVNEITGIDRSCIFFMGKSGAASPRPLVVLSFDKTQGRFALDKKLMLKPPFSRDQFDALSLQYKNDTRWHRESRPPADLFGTMLRLIYSGNEEQAWELFDASWPDGSPVSKEEYKEGVEAELSRSPFYPVIAGWNKEKS